MSKSAIDRTPLFQLRADVRVAATPDKIYAVVSDMNRSAEWSMECCGGEWVSGEPATVGAVFRGENFRADSVVAWAPVPRGVWYTHTEVIAAEPGRTFRWETLDTSGVKEGSAWGFDIETADEGCVLVHHYQMSKATAGIHRIVANMGEVDKERFIADWTAKLQQNIETTLQRVKDLIEKH
ncbi:MAG: SRPBCC family protein [Pseudonocardiaceae bacterium]